MGVAAENRVHTVQPAVGRRTGGDLGREAQPACVQAIDQAGEPLAFEVEFLQQEEEPGAKIAEYEVIDQRAVELVPVDGEVAPAAVFPNVFLINRDADQMRHHVGETLIVIALDPDYFHVALGIR